MARPVVVRVGQLLLELLADADILRNVLQAAGAVAARALEALADGFDDFLIRVQVKFRLFHSVTSFTVLRGTPARSRCSDSVRSASGQRCGHSPPQWK